MTTSLTAATSFGRSTSFHFRAARLNKKQAKNESKWQTRPRAYVAQILCRPWPTMSSTNPSFSYFNRFCNQSKIEHLTMVSPRALSTTYAMYVHQQHAHAWQKHKQNHKFEFTRNVANTTRTTFSLLTDLAISASRFTASRRFSSAPQLSSR